MSEVVDKMPTYTGSRACVNTHICVPLISPKPASTAFTGTPSRSSSPYISLVLLLATFYAYKTDRTCVPRRHRSMQQQQQQPNRLTHFICAYVKIVRACTKVFHRCAGISAGVSVHVCVCVCGFLWQSEECV